MSGHLRAFIATVALAATAAVPFSAHAGWDDVETSGDPADWSEYHHVVALADGSALFAGHFRGELATYDSGSEFHQFVQYRDASGAVQWTEELDLDGPTACDDPLLLDQSDQRNSIGTGRDDDGTAYFGLTTCTGRHLVSADATGVVAARRVDVDNGVVPPPDEWYFGCCTEGFASFAVDRTGGVHVVARSKVFEGGSSDAWKLFQLDENLVVESATPLPTDLSDVGEDGWGAALALSNLVSSNGSGWVVGFRFDPVEPQESALVLVRVGPGGGVFEEREHVGFGCTSFAEELPQISALQSIDDQLWVVACSSDADENEILVIDETTGAILDRVPTPDTYNWFDALRWMGTSTDGSIMYANDLSGPVAWRYDGPDVDDPWDPISLDPPPDPAVAPYSEASVFGVDVIGDDLVYAGSDTPAALWDDGTGDGPSRARVDRFELPTLTAVSPARVADSRPSGSTVDGQHMAFGRRPARSVTPIEIAGRAGVLADAAAAVVYVTAVRPDGKGYATVYPCDANRPLASSLNFEAGATTGNSTTSALDPSGKLCVYLSEAADLVVDVNAFYRPTPSFSTIVPTRVTDSRPNGDTVDGASEATGRFEPGEQRTIPVAGRGTVPGDTATVVANLTAVRTVETGYLTVWNCDDPMPATSSMNFGPGQTRAAQTIVGLSASGDLCVLASAELDLVVDVTAPLGADAGQRDLEALRFADTRPQGDTFDGAYVWGGPIPAGGTHEIRTNRDVEDGHVLDKPWLGVFNLTVARPQANGYATLYPCQDGIDAPNAASVNFLAGVNTSNTVTLRLDPGPGRVCIFTSAESHFVLDLVSSR